MQNINLLIPTFLVMAKAYPNLKVGRLYYRIVADIINLTQFIELFLIESKKGFNIWYLLPAFRF